MLVSLRQSDETWRIAMMLPGRTTLQYLETQGDAFDPALAPDHARIAFTSTRDNGSVGRIWLLDLTTGALRPISDPQLDCQFPAWSPDGLSLIYTADQPGTTEPVARNYIYQVRSDLSTRWVDAHTGWSDWSSRNEIVFTRNTGQSYDLFRANSDGSGLVNLTNSVDANEDIAAWSPDGQMIAFVRNARDGSGDRQVMVMDRDGANMRQLTSFPGPNSNPAWLPDGQWLLFANQLDEQTRQPWLLNIRTGTLTRVAANTDRVWFMSGVR
jgi:TolB protein